jgi:fluoride exporter
VTGWQAAVAVLAGGGIGSLIRYLITFSVTQRFGPGFPWATLIINVTGSFVIGLVAEMTQTRAFAGGQLLRIFLMTGVLGGYTTFSTFSFDTVNLLSERAALLAFSYAAGSVVLGIAAAFGGMALVRALSAS